MTGTATNGEMDAPHRPVEAPSEILADLRRQLDADPGLDSWQLAAYAQTLGLRPPAEPAGYLGWAIIEVSAPDDPENTVLYWWGPEEDQGY